MRDFTLTQEQIIATCAPVRTQGATSEKIRGLQSLDKAQAGDVSFLGNSAYEAQVTTSNASILILPKDFQAAPKEGQLQLFCTNASLAFARVCGLVERQLYPKALPGIHPSAIVDRDAQVHPDAHIGALCVIGAHAQVHKGATLHAGVYIGAYASVGAGTELKPQVKVMEDCVIGERCIVHAGAVIGSDGYGFEFNAGKFEKVPQIGNVIVESDVEIGANTTVDRARFGSTRIGAGSKLDNLVQIAHNVNIGCNCLLVAQTGIAGSSILEDYVVMGGQSGVGGHVRVGAQTQVAAQSAVLSSVPGKQKLSGTPAQELRDTYRQEVLKRKLPELNKRVSEIEEQLKKIPQK
jgi:UDP-3-O-[3-hydroxymyristoyl] glucosamine N-acyltransferase